MTTRRAGARRWAARLALWAVGLSASVAGCRGRSPSPYHPPPAPSASSSVVPENAPDPSRPHVAELDLSRGAPEIISRSLLAPARDRSFADLIQRLRELGGPKDARTKGVLVRFGGASMGFARAQELSEALGRLRSRGLPVVCHADELSNATYWVAAAGCDRIWISPAGGVETIGIAGQVLYGRKLLSELKVDVDMLQVGRFKGASEPLTRDGPSDEARESLMGTLRSMRTVWLAGVGKRLPKGADPAVLEQGPYAPEEARAKGLIDQVGYYDEARSEAQARAAVDQTVARFGPEAKGTGGSGLVGLVRVLSGAGEGFDLPHVTLVRASGSIAMRSSGMLSGDDGISERRMAKLIDRIAKDRSARAVVIRIDSPGGSALASDLIWHRLMDLRKTRPVVVSIGDMAASGGYYLASAGSRVMAEPTSIVGSIGVVGGKLSVGRALEHIGVHAETFPASDAPGARSRAAYLSAVEGWDQSTRERLLATMTSVYDLFVRRVCEGRGLPPEKVNQFAEGRIFAATDAIGMGMVDELGGVEKAISHALTAAGLPEDAPVRVLGEESGLEQLLGLDDDEEASEEARAAVVAGGSGPALLRQVAPELLPFAGALAPVMSGEHALVAVPFAFLVR